MNRKWEKVGEDEWDYDGAQCADMSVKGRGAEAHPDFDLEAEKSRRAECTGTGVHADRILDIVSAGVWVSVLVN
ncbi:unnamed protein product [Onchocerca flexuosa]|uniref:Protein kinase domain-containing protein n=1 Tax=Onchocerca flexuosa TaxID=387005 RepID=A0A183HB21_9BILA|nr:unnamed protein product [Onchocerca flexuosa]